MHHGQLVEDGLGNTPPFSLTGWPCVVVRCGTSASELPIGVRIVAGPCRDDLALALATTLETALGGDRPPPI